MLKQKTLVDVLGQLNTSGVEATMLLNREGLLLAYNGVPKESNSNEKGVLNKNVSAALVAGIWENFDRKGGREDLREVLLVNEDGQLAVTKVANMLLAIRASSTVQPGLLRAKLRALAKCVDEPLTLVSTNS